MSPPSRTRAAPLVLMLILVASCLVLKSEAWTPPPPVARGSALGASLAPPPGDAWFAAPVGGGGEATKEWAASGDVARWKVQLLQLGAALDRGTAYNPTSGAYYAENIAVARSTIGRLLDAAAASTVPVSLADIDGEWELVLSTVPHGIFRSSPFFLAIQEAYEFAAEKTFADGRSKPELFFKLHELQTCSWGVSKVGRIAQHIDAEAQYLYSTFDTSLFSLTVIPILGWFKLLPTFGGCVVTAATCRDLTPDTFGGRPVARLDMVVDYTTSRKVEGLAGLPLLGDVVWKIKVPVGAIWKLLPWNRGREASCKVYVNYVDDDVRIVQDIDGEYFVYTRPVVPRPLEIY